MHKQTVRRAAIITGWIMLWQIAALFVHNPIYFAGPAETVGELSRQAATALFWQSVAATLSRILSGFFIAGGAACLLSWFSYRHFALEELLAPFIALLRSVPVAAVVVILLIWWGSRNLVLAISFMVIFPNFYGNLLTGLKKTDRKLLEMAEVFHVKPLDRLNWIYRPACRPYLNAALSYSLGMGFKSGIAAEIIALPSGSIGEQLYRDKIYLNTAGVFAWIVVILAVSAITERLLLYLFHRLAGIPSPMLREQAAPAPDTVPASAPIEAQGLTKSYEGRNILRTDLQLAAGGIYCLSGSSGTGKTTLLHLLAGLIPADAGHISKVDIRMVFQEDRLIPGANMIRNLKLAGCCGEFAKALLEILPEELADRPTELLSGGERRRLAVARAVLAPCNALLMDEPFAGLDPDTREKVIRFILSNRRERTLLIVTHDKADADLLGAQKLYLDGGIVVQQR